MQENPMVDTSLQEAGPDDAAINASESTQAEGATLDDVLGTQPDVSRPESSQPEEQKGGEKQAGWIQKRIQDGVNKQIQSVLAQERAKIAAEYDSKLRPLQEAMLSRDADDLVSSGKVASREIALEYLRLKNGLPTQSAEPEKSFQPVRNEKGQFTGAQSNQSNQSSQSSSPDDAEAYGQMLIAQAKAIEAAGGIDVLEVYNTDPEVKRRVLSREWDFADVYKHMAGKSAHTLPTPSRRPNGSGFAARSIGDLSSEQFKKVQDYLAQGGVIDMRT
jgi:hypothetical protein